MNLLNNARHAILFWAAVSYALNLYIIGNDIYHNQVSPPSDGAEPEDVARATQNTVSSEVYFMSMFATLAFLVSICRANMHSALPICVLNLSEIIFILYNEGIYFVGTAFLGVFFLPNQD